MLSTSFAYLIQCTISFFQIFLFISNQSGRGSVPLANFPDQLAPIHKKKVFEKNRENVLDIYIFPIFFLYVNVRPSLTSFRAILDQSMRLVHVNAKSRSNIVSKQCTMELFSKGEKILEQLSRTRFFMGFENRALFFPATIIQK